jgi:CPA1 family monovalent cation:H+ antiporter
MSNTVTVNVGLILLVACVVAMASQRIRLPYSVGLVTAGILLALLPLGVAIPLSPDSIFTIFLPPLIFEAALQICWPAFRGNLPVILLLALPGSICAAVLVAVGMHLLIGWGWLGAAMFGFDRRNRSRVGNCDLQGTERGASPETAGGGRELAE